jgi:hypothetical protein
VSRKLPKMRLTVIPVPMGKDHASLIYNWSLEALVVSRGHYRKKSGSWNGGGPFLACKETCTHIGGHEFDNFLLGVSWKGRALGVSAGNKLPPTQKSGTFGFTGGQNGTISPNGTLPGYTSFNDHVAASIGKFATGWARTRPGNAQAAAFVSGVELYNDGLPAIPLRSFLRRHPVGRWGKLAFDYTKFMSKLGSEYLNVEFGWKPFVRDLQAIYSLMHNVDKQLAQIRRDNHRLIRRRAQVEDSTDSSEVVLGTHSATPNVGIMGAPPDWFALPANTIRTRTTTTKISSWFAAAYMYHIRDTLPGGSWERRAKAVLFGALPTPDAVWNAVPWSWMIDWFTNFGDVISNLSPNAVDNLVAKYAYIMTHTNVTTCWTCVTSFTGKTPSSDVRVAGGSYSTSTKRTVETKFRCSGSPYGLGVSYGSLSANQKTILAALGLSRSRF